MTHRPEHAADRAAWTAGTRAMSAAGRWALGAAIAFGGHAAADSIVIDGELFEDVFVRSTDNMYYVQLPDEGRVISAARDRVDNDTVEISSDEDHREELLLAWEEAREQRFDGDDPAAGIRGQADALRDRAARVEAGEPMFDTEMDLPDDVDTEPIDIEGPGPGVAPDVGDLTPEPGEVPDMDMDLENGDEPEMITVPEGEGIEMPSPGAPGPGQDEYPAPGPQPQPGAPGPQQQPGAPGPQQQPGAPGPQQQPGAPGPQQQPGAPGPQPQPGAPGPQQQPGPQ